MTLKRSQCTQIMNIHIHANFYKVVMITGREDGGGGVVISGHVKPRIKLKLELDLPRSHLRHNCINIAT